MPKTKSWVDLALAAAVAIAAFVLLLIWDYPLVHPASWDDMAIASGLLPQNKMLPGLGMMISHWLFCLMPFSSALAFNTFLGKLTISACGFFAFFAFSDLMALVSGLGARDIVRRQLAIRVAAAVSAMMFVLSEPMWVSAQDFTGHTFMVFLLVFSIFAFARLLMTASPFTALMALGSGGLLCAEVPMGWLFLIVGLIAVARYLRDAQGSDWDEFLDPVRIQRAKWTMTFLFLSMFVIGVVLEIYSYVILEGNRANGVSLGDLPGVYFTTALDWFLKSTTVAGCISLIVAAVLPVAVSTLMVTQATDEDRFLSFKIAIIFIITGTIAFLQLSPFDFAWFWNIVGLGSVKSRSVILGAEFLSAITLGWSVYVLCVEVFCRNYKHIERVYCQSDSEDGEGSLVRGGRDNVKSVRLTFMRMLPLVMPLLILSATVWGRRSYDDRSLCSVMNEFVNETIDELGDCKYLFTDGSYDSAYRLEAARRGKKIVTISLMADKSLRESYIRQQGTEGFDDRVTLEKGSVEALRTWVTAKSERLSECAVQLAFEMFSQNRRLKPVIYGTMVHPKSGDEAKADASFERCHALADRIVELHETGVWRHARSKRTQDRFLFAQFRLAVMSRLRAIKLDAAGKSKESKEEIAYSDRLNASNPSLVKILKNTDWVMRQRGGELTPREGLEVALKRADFVMARRYAMPILKEDVDEPNANFAMGMSYYAEEQYAKAEDYLKRVLKRIPDEPAVHNNLALLYLKTGRLEEAQKYADKAIKMMPDSEEARDTVRRVQKAISERKAKKF